MRSPAAAFAWELRRRHHWALIALIVYLLVLATIKPLILAPGKVVSLFPPDGMAGLLIAPFGITFMYFVAVFSFGFAGDLAARQSIYPARLFARPVTTAALAGWPMLYGAAAMASLWLMMALFARWSWGISLPLILPALLAAAFLAWMQALAWMPYGLPGLRLIVAVLWLTSLDAIIMLALYFKTPEPLMVAFLAPQLPLAYLAARHAVARARRGDVPDWRGMFRRRQIAGVPPGRRDSFASPARAQVWFEWRQHGSTLPVWVGILLPFELALLFLADPNAPSFVYYTLLVVLLTPPVIAAFVAATVSKSNPQVRDDFGMMPFIATRPLTSAALVAAKLTMTIWTTLAAWLLVLLAIPLALSLSGTWPAVIEPASRGIDAIGAPRATVIVLLLFTGLLASTWKQLVQGLYIGLTGRAWLIKANAALLLSILVVIGPLADWIVKNRELLALMCDALPWILAGLMCVKLSAAAWVATRLYHGRVVSDRTLVTGAAVWLAAVEALRALLVWFVDTPAIASYFLTLVAILAIPLARVSAAPLALAWNRHR